MYVCSCEFGHFCDFILPFCFPDFKFYFMPVVLAAENCTTNWNHSEESAKKLWLETYLVYSLSNIFVCSKSKGINCANSESLTF